MDVSPWMNAQGGPSEAWRAKEGASADCAEEMKDTADVSPWRLHIILVHTCLGLGEVMQSQQAMSPKILGTNLDVNRHFRMQKGL